MPCINLMGYWTTLPIVKVDRHTSDRFFATHSLSVIDTQPFLSRDKKSCVGASYLSVDHKEINEQERGLEAT